MWEVPIEIYACHLKHGVHCANAHETRVPLNTFTDTFCTEFQLNHKKNVKKKYVFTPLSRVRLSLHRLSWNSTALHRYRLNVISPSSVETY